LFALHATNNAAGNNHQRPNKLMRLNPELLIKVGGISKMRKILLLTLTAVFQLLSFQVVNAKIKLPAIVSSNMVLQRNSHVTLWGWADPYEQIEIKASWLMNTLQLEADKAGNWRIEVKTTKSKEPQIIELHSKTSDITLENVLFGEVWLCSGQSNMEMPVKGYNGQPIFGSLSAIARSNNPNLRLFTVNPGGSKTPLKDVEKYISWQQATPESVSDFSAVGYFFGQQLQEILDVPVGLISTSYGASSVEAWMSKEVMNRYQEINLENVDITKNPNKTPTALFNSMIHPLIPYTIKGVIWYQGEANRREPVKYKELFPAMVKDWRTRWGLGDFPFYYVQIAPFLYNNKNDIELETTKNSAFLREAQLECLDLIPNSGIAITLDIGNAEFIHPPKKKEVADRLLYNALNQTYGFNAVDYASPRYDSHEIKDGGIVLSFKNAEAGLYCFDKLEGFEISGNDKIFYPAEAKIVDRNKIIVKSEKVTEPKAVRYAWRNWVIGTLYATSLLPVSSFRTYVDDPVDGWAVTGNPEKYFSATTYKLLESTPESIQIKKLKHLK